MHRDIKPDNILVDRDDLRPQIVIADLGAAKKMDSRSSLANCCIGTNGYIAPEVYNHSLYD